MARSLSSRSSSSSPTSQPEFQQTNTLAVTSLPKSFFEPLVLQMLRDHFAAFGDINQWVPLQGFGRIIVVYESAHHAELAKRQCDPILIDGRNDEENIVLRVYRADPNPLIPRGEQKNAWMPHSSYLRPPPVEKNFLISPPGSPPVGWEQIREDPPNATPLADDLIVALRRLQTHDEARRKPSFEQLLDPMDGSGVSVYVEDYDVEEHQLDFEISEEEWVYGESAPARQKWKPAPTSCPPMPSHLC
jgi:hypothetical protein